MPTQPNIDPAAIAKALNIIAPAGQVTPASSPVDNSSSVIPSALRERPQWVAWKWGKDKDGRPTKVPYNVRSGANYKAQSDDPRTWGSFTQASQICADGQADGIGYVFAADDPFTGIDLDHCRNPHTGEIDAWAQRIITILDSYSEASPSGTGVHVITDATKPGVKCKRPIPGSTGGAVEMYSEGRFFTMTGQHLDGTPAGVERREMEVAAVYRDYLDVAATKAAPASPQRDITPISLDDEAIIAKAQRARNGAKFSALWSGDTSAYDGDESRADLALCGILAFWTQGNAAQMDRMFRSSACVREKWDTRHSGDGSTYGEMTIAAALAGKSEFYNPVSSRHQGSPPDSATADLTEQIRALIATAAESHDASIVFQSVPLLAALPAAELGAAKAALKQALGTGLNLNDLDKAIREARRKDRPAAPPPSEGKRDIIASNRSLEDLSTESLAALVDANAPAVFFRRSGGLARIVQDEDDRLIIDTVGPAEMRGRLARVANFWKVNDEGDIFHVDPSDHLVQDLLQRKDWFMPSLAGVTEIPTLRPNGTILDTPGYDRDTRLYYRPSADFHMPAIPRKMTQDLAQRAARYLLTEVFGDFPFATPADRANALALLLTPILRPSIDGQVPLALIDAPTAGTGKSKLAEGINLIATGRKTAMMTAPTTEEEWQKKLSTALMIGATIITIDNIDGKLDSAELASVLTTPVRQDRILGKNEMGSWPQRATWMATGNNVRLGKDIPRRCYRIRLDAQMERPWLRESESFRHADLLGWIAEHRGDLIAALLTMVRAWHEADCPSAKGPTLGSFEEWSQKVGDILAYANITGFLGNLDDLYQDADDDAPQWEAFLSAWYDRWGAKAMKMAAVVKHLHTNDATAEEIRAALPDNLSDALDTNKMQRRLAWAFRLKLGTRFGTQQYRIIKDGGSGHAVCWRVLSLADSSELVSHKESYSSPTRENTPPSQEGYKQGGVYQSNGGGNDSQQLTNSPLFDPMCADVAPVYEADAPHMQPPPGTLLPDVTAPPLFTSSSPSAPAPATRGPTDPNAWRTDHDHPPTGRLCLDCGDLARHWRWNDTHRRWECPTCAVRQRPPLAKGA